MQSSEIGNVSIFLLSDISNINNYLFSGDYKINKITMTILRPNRPRKTSEEIDYIMKQMRANESKIIMENEEEGLNPNTELVLATIDKASEGRSSLDAVIETKDGSKKTISTAEKTKYVTIPGVVQGIANIASIIYDVIKNNS